MISPSEGWIKTMEDQRRAMSLGLDAQVDDINLTTLRTNTFNMSDNSLMYNSGSVSASNTYTASDLQI